MFANVDSSLLRRPTYEQYAALMNNWNRVTGVREPAVSEKEVGGHGILKRKAF